MHSVLLRQLARLGLDGSRAPEPSSWAEFLAVVSAAYNGYDQDRYLLERSLTLSSTEMGDLHARLRHDRERLSAVIDSLDQGLVVLDRNLTVETVNPEAARILGASPEDLRAWTVHDLCRCAAGDPPMAAMFAEIEAHPSGGPPDRRACDDGRIRGADGRIVPVSASVIPIGHGDTVHGVVVVLRDISERQRLEVELRQAQKLEAVGLLAAGVAHEINTPMQFVGDNLAFIEKSVSSMLPVLEAAKDFVGDPAPSADTARAVAELIDDCDPAFLSEELPQALAQSREGIDRVTSIVRAMKSFSHPGDTTMALADLNQALRDTITVARGELRSVADVTLDLADLPLVTCMIHDLKQVFLNLVVNASHAIADRARERPGQGTIVVTSARHGDEAVITIADDGCGIPDHLVDRIFEPFFTTKEVGRGTGQGLALARQVVVGGHRGRLSFTTQPGSGSTFEIRLPINGK